MYVWQVWRHNDKFRHGGTFNCNERKSNFAAIDRQYSVSHTLIKSWTSGMNTQEIKRAAGNMIEDLTRKIELSLIHEDIDTKLKLGIDTNWKEWPWTPKSADSSLHLAISKAKTFPHVKGKVYTVEQLKELEKLIEEFPGDQLKIMKALKIPKSTFYRIKKEFKAAKSRGFGLRRRFQNHSNLSPIEKEYIFKIVKPPTSPKTIKSIRK